MNLRSAALMAVVVWVSSCSVSRCLAQETLRWEFAEGDHYLLERESTQAMARSESDFNRSIAIRLTFDCLVLAVDDEGNAAIQYTIARGYVSDSMGREGPFTYDTENPTDLADQYAQEKAEELHAMLGVTFEIEMSSRGEILEVRVPEETRRAFAEDDPNFEPEDLSHMQMDGWPILPESTVEEGDGWEIPVAQEMVAHEFNIDSTVTRAATEEIDGAQVAVIELTSVLTPKENERRADSSQRLHSQDCKSKVLFDLDAGCLLESSAQVSFVWIDDSEATAKTHVECNWTLSQVEEE